MAFTEAQQFLTVVGDKYFISYKLTGDGSDTTWTAPLSTIEGAWIQMYSTTGAGTTPTITWATNVLTFTIAPASSQVVHVFVIGH